ncbi:hypothetical protein Lal_00039341, partial [Lupinus albus]
MTLKTKKTKKQSNSKYKNKKNKRGPKAHIGENEIERGRGILRREVRRRRKRENRGGEKRKRFVAMRRRRRFVTAGRRRRFVTAGRRRRFGSTVFFSDYLLRYSDAVVPTKLITCLDIPLSVTWNVANTPLLSIAKPDKFIVIKSRYIQFWIQHYIPH